jgi:xylose isomerase
MPNSEGWSTWTEPVLKPFLMDRQIMNSYFSDIQPVAYEGQESLNPLAFKWYDANRMVLGKSMAEHLRFAVCYWHSFCWNGSDPFGGDSFLRPWQLMADPMAGARAKADAAFEFFAKLGAPYYCFHDRDVAPEGATPRESVSRLHEMVDVLAQKQADTGMKLLWGTANLFSHRRFMSGASTNPDPEIFGLAALQVKEAMDATFKLGGENYVLWGGREGYETLLNTRLGQELDQMGRFLNMVVEYKHKIGFKGTILIEPKPREPTKHQYDFDTATVYGFLCRYGLDKEIKVNIEANHATLSGHSFEHEVATALDLGIFGSIDMNRGDMQCGWDTDQFPNNVAESALVMYLILKGGGFTTGGLNFDAKVRRQSIDPADLFYGHIGGMDVSARALLVAEKMLQDDRLAQHVQARYAGWSEPFGQDILAGRLSLDQLSARALERDQDILPVSGRQEYLENLLNHYL